jgi:uncharacterized protein YukE
MSSEDDLREAASPDVLIPGSPALVAHAGAQFVQLGSELDETASGLMRLDSSHWTGKAADAFRAKFDVQPKRWQQASDAFTAAGKAVNSYAQELDDAQTQAGQAFFLYRKGVTATQVAEDEYWDQVDLLRQQHHAAALAGVVVPFHAPAFVDPGATLREQAVAILDTARSNVKAGGDAAHDRVVAATQDAPHKPSFWSRMTTDIGNWAGDAAVFVESLSIDVYNKGIVPAVNGLADVGAAMVDDPGDTLKMVGGTLLMGLGGGIEAGGGALDATGIGAIAGVPVNALGVAVIGSGAAVVASGGIGIANKAGTEDMNVMHAASKGQRIQDPGYGATPVRSAGAGAPPEGAAPYDPDVAGRVPEWGTKSGKTQGILVKDTGEEMSLQSGIDGPAKDAVGGPGSGLDGTLKTHVEAHAGSALQPGDDAALYLNRTPCSSTAKPGCMQMLSRYVPKGATLTVYGPDDFVMVVQGARL